MWRSAWLLVAVIACSSKERETTRASAPVATARDAAVDAAPVTPLSAAADPWAQPAKPRSDDPFDAIPDGLEPWIMPGSKAALRGTLVGLVPHKLGVIPRRFLLEMDREVPGAISITGATATVLVGTSRYEMKVSVDLPCAFSLWRTEKGSWFAARTDFRFAISNGTLLVSRGPVGIRKGKHAFICDEDGRGYIDVDETGDCRRHSSPWAHPVCTWSTDGTRTTLTVAPQGIQKDDPPTTYTLDGDVLLSDEFLRDAKLRSFTHVKDLAAARAWIAAHAR